MASNTRHMTTALDALDQIAYPHEVVADNEGLRPRMSALTSDASTVAFQHVRRHRWPDDFHTDDPRNRLATLAASASLVADLESSNRTVVGQARALGATWEQIGRAIGVTKQAAQQRYGSG